MYISNIKLWNFRKFGSTIWDNDAPHLDLNFTKGLNVIIGENDSGKTAIIDAIKLVLKTHSYEWIRVENEDFFGTSDRLRIEVLFQDFTPEEAKNFTEWLGWKGEGKAAEPYLRLILDVRRSSERILPSEVRAGVDEDGTQLSAEAREYLKTTYLKPLRDAQADLVAKKNSRLSQILLSDDAFKGREKSHPLVGIFYKFSSDLTKYFEGSFEYGDADGNKITPQEGRRIKQQIDRYIKSFHSDKHETEFEAVTGDVKPILEKLTLTLRNDANPGLGTLNRLYMAAELLHLGKENWDGVRLGLVEELEAHLHPQAQMQVIETLQEQEDIQLILTTHSPNLASKVELQNLIICNNNHAFPMGADYTNLNAHDYKFLERFLDVTKSNLFFAKGVILVEGWSEEILLPFIASRMKKLGIIDKDLTKAGVSVVNVGNTAFLRYAKIFLRKTEPHNSIPVSIVTDLDLKPKEYEAVKKITATKTKKKNLIISGFDPQEIEAYKTAKTIKEQTVETFISPHWTLEYCLGLSTTFRKPFYKAVLTSLRDTKVEKGLQNTTKYDEAISKVEECFNNWTDDKNAIALTIYLQIIGEKKFAGLSKIKLSKTLIAQNFVQIIEETEIQKENLENDQNVTYLLDAVKHVTQD